MKTIEKEVRIENYNKKGWGVGRELSESGEGCHCEVPFTAIGDVVKASFFKKKNKVFLGRVLELIEASSSRVEPKCPHARACGGCSWQHINYEDQLKEKQQFIENLFSEILQDEKATLYPIIQTEVPWQYRNKMEFSFSEDSKGNHYLGLIEANSNGLVINLKQCHLASSWMTQVLEAMRTFWISQKDLKAYNPRRNTGVLRTLTLREGIHTKQKLIMLTISGNAHERFSQRLIDGFKECVLSCFPKEEILSVFLQVIQAKEGMPTQVYEMHLHGRDHIVETLSINYEDSVKTFDFKISPSSFFQPNTKQAEKLYSRALAMITRAKEMNIVDLYCGTGALGIVFSHLARKVIGVEINPYAVFDAEVNLRANAVHNVVIHRGDVKNVLEEFKDSGELLNPDLVIVDPPRAGLDAKALLHVIQLDPKEILYISCNPATQKENILDLLKSGFSLKAMQPVDMFPHTSHIENIVILQKKTNEMSV